MIWIVFRTVGYPNIDLNNGATLKGMLDALQILADAAGPNTKVVPGHGDITNKAAIVAHREMAVAVRDRVAKLIQEGKTQEQAVAAKPTADFDAKVGNAAERADRFVTHAYTELKRTNATHQANPKPQIPNPKSQLDCLGLRIWVLGFGFWDLFQVLAHQLRHLEHVHR